MNPANIVDCLCDLVKKNLSLHLTSDISSKECEIAQHLYETIVTSNKCKRYEYKEETTLDLDEISDDYESEVDDNTFHDDDSSEADDEWESEGKEREAYSVKGYSLEYLKEVVAYVDAKDSSGKRRRSRKTVHHKYKKVPDQSHISRFRKYIEEQGTKRQRTLNLDEMMFKMFVGTREKSLMVHVIDIKRRGLKEVKEVKLDEFSASNR